MTCSRCPTAVCQVGGMRLVSKPRVSESEKPAEKTKEEGEEVSS